MAKGMKGSGIKAELETSQSFAKVTKGKYVKVSNGACSGATQSWMHKSTFPEKE